MNETEQVVFMVTDKPIISLKHEQLKPHKLNMDIFGDLSANEYNDLKQDIQNRGIQDPLHVVKQNGGYIVVSGHQRLRVAIELGINLPCIVRTDLKEDWQVEEQLIKDNLLRRHLNDYQKVRAGERLEPIEETKAKIRQQNAGAEYGQVAHLKHSMLVAAFPQANELSNVVNIEQPDSECESCDNEYPDLECDSCIYNAKTTMLTQREQEILSHKPPTDLEKLNLGEKLEHIGKENAKTAQKTRDIVASQIGMSGRQYDNAKKVMHEAPEPIRQKWQTGEITTGTAIREMKKEEKKQQISQRKEEFIKQSHTAVQDNRPKVYHKDCIEWIKSLDNDYADLLITDPPYMTDVDDINDFSKWVLLALEKVKPSGKAYICTGPYPKELNAYLTALLSQDKFEISNVLVWTYRNTLGPSPKTAYKNNWQAIFYLVGKDTKPLKCPTMLEQFSVQDINAPDGRQGNRFHTWQKPDELAKRLITHSTNENDIIIDPFNGTGTFVLAGAKQKRVSFGCDNNIDILKIAEERGCNVVW